jgi:hypothetical protein
MHKTHRLSRLASALGVALSLTLLGGAALAADLKLSGDNEVPPVKTAAAGSGTITVAYDGMLAGSVKTTGVTGNAAHIHMGAKGSNGPVIITLTQGADGVWSVPPGTKLTAEQLKSFKAGNLYVNVHSEANKGGEIRDQIAP